MEKRPINPCNYQRIKGLIKGQKRSPKRLAQVLEISMRPVRLLEAPTWLTTCNKPATEIAGITA